MTIQHHTPLLDDDIALLSVRVHDDITDMVTVDNATATGHWRASHNTIYINKKQLNICRNGK